MIADQTRNEVWQELLDIERRCRYYEVVHTRAVRWQLLIRSSSLLFLAVGPFAVMGAIPGPALVYQVVIAAAVAGLTILDFVLNLGKKAAVAQSIYTNCFMLRIPLKDLWLSVDNESSEDAVVRDRLRELSGMAGHAELLAGASDFTTDKKLNLKTTKEAYFVAQDRYTIRTPKA